jgi:hypothetical protein
MTDDQIKQLASHIRGDLYTLGFALFLFVGLGTMVVVVSVDSIASILCAQHPVEICKGR